MFYSVEDECVHKKYKDRGEMKYPANYGNISLLSVLSNIYSGAQLVSRLRGNVLVLNFG